MAEPVDKCNVVYLIFYMLGLGLLLPWNFFINANDYWLFKLQDNNTHFIPPTSSTQNITILRDDVGIQSENSLQSLFQNVLSLCAMLPNVIFQFLNAILHQQVPEKLRILMSLIMMVAIFIVTSVLVMVDVSSWREEFFIVTMICVVIINSCSAIAQSSLYGLTSNLPPKYIQGFMAGQGMGGLFASVAMVVALAASPGPLISALVYFVLAVFVLVLTTISYLILIRNSYYSYYSNRNVIINENHRASFNQINVERSLEFDEDIRSTGGESIYNSNVWMEKSFEDVDERAKLISEVEYTNISSSLKIILKKIWLDCFCCFFTFFITLACFPSITSSVRSFSVNTTWKSVYFTPVSCFLCFNLSDWIGRSSAGYIHFPSERNVIGLFVCVVLRIFFPFLFGFCNVQPRSLPVVFKHDAYFIVIILLFGFTNGHLSTLVMQYGPKRVEPHHSVSAGTILGFFLVLGLAAGAGFSFLIKLVL